MDLGRTLPGLCRKAILGLNGPFGKDATGTGCARFLKGPGSKAGVLVNGSLKTKWTGKEGAVAWSVLLRELYPEGGRRAGRSYANHETFGFPAPAT